MDGQRQETDAGRTRQTQIYLNGLGGRQPAISTDYRQLEQQARRAMSPEGFAYIAGGAGQESTMDANRAALDRWRIRQRMLRDVARRDTSISLFGQSFPTPFLLAPIGVLEMAHEQADLAVARAAAAEQVPMIFSNQASVPMEECAAAMGEAPRWFQLYWSRSNELVRSFVKRAENSGCSAIVLTLDTTLLGWRPRDLDLGHLPFLRGRGIAQYTSDPVFRKELNEPLESPAGSVPLNLSALRAAAEMAYRYPGPSLLKILSGEPRAAVQRFTATYSRPSLTWTDLAFLRDLTRLPILLKGIVHPDDAQLAVEHGMDGIIVSNHGGRQVDGALGAADALPDVVAAVAGRVPVLFDSGIRGGADAIKALALGATAVCIGRPYAYGLAVAGEQGVREVIQNLRADFNLTLGLTGHASVAELDQSCLVRQPGA